MVKRIKKNTHEEKNKKRNLYISLFILAIMILSIVGFAMMNGGNTTGTSENEIPKDLSLREINQNGTNYFVAIKNYQIFVFDNLDGYDSRDDLASLANQIKNKTGINIYVDKDFTSSDARFMVDKVLTGLEINSTEVNQTTCEDENTLVLTNNRSFEGSCMKFISDKGAEYLDSNILVYQLIK